LPDLPPGDVGNAFMTAPAKGGARSRWAREATAPRRKR
jgi:hypothetical protein